MFFAYLVLSVLTFTVLMISWFDTHTNESRRKIDNLNQNCETIKRFLDG